MHATFQNLNVASLVKLSQRKRKRCRKCNQELSHSAYARHLNTSICPEVRCNTSEAARFEEDSVLEENSAENGDALQEDILAENADALQEQVLAVDNASVEEACDTCSASSSSSESSLEDESQECISCSEEVDTLSASDCEYKEVSGDQSVESMKCIAVQICVFKLFSVVLSNFRASHISSPKFSQNPIVLARFILS